jgi:magnesium chelatase family protein
VEVPVVEYEKLSDAKITGESSNAIQKRVLSARERQTKRFNNYSRKILTNSEMGVKELKKFIPMTENLNKVLNNAAKQLDLSARAYHRVIKLARTIADLEGTENIAENHLFEALQYRPQ